MRVIESERGATVKTFCEWRFCRDWYPCWSTSCNANFRMANCYGTPSEHCFRFCPNCGLTIAIGEPVVVDGTITNNSTTRSHHSMVSGVSERL